MPDHEEHCKYSLKKYGKGFSELHGWMDEPWEILGKQHRMYRHDPYTTPEEAKKLFGEYADHACLDHIMLDWRESPKGFSSNFKPYPRRGMPAGICPRCGSTLVWRKARLKKELYKGCTNYQGGCRYHTRSYRYTPGHLKHTDDWYYDYEEERFPIDDDRLRGPDDSHFWDPAIEKKTERRGKRNSKK